MPSDSMAAAELQLFVGIDLGTSGCRAIAIDGNKQVMAECSLPLTADITDDVRHEQDPQEWWRTTQRVLGTLLNHVDAERIVNIAVDATSGTVMLTDDSGKPCSPALMYNDARCVAESERIAACAPRDSAAHGTSSGLAKLLYLQSQRYDDQPTHVVHQADWIAGQLCRRYDISDENNCLKMGYDVVHRCWPDWFGALQVNTDLLPHVVPPATIIGTVDRQMASALGLSAKTRILAGTTDGVAAFLATGAHEIGDAVTSLGTTLVVKVLSDKPVFAPEYGIYSHRLGDKWLVGGASNAGGITLQQYFSRAQLDSMMDQLKPEQPTGYQYYPLPGPGERFPFCDPAMKPRLEPRPDDDVVFYQAILEGIADIEARGYERLADLGAPRPTTIRTVGGGARNTAWKQIRQQRLQGIALQDAQHPQAAYGTALLAMQPTYADEAVRRNKKG